MILQDILNKIKSQPSSEIISFNEQGEVVSSSLFRKLFLSLLMILVASLSFGLGRLSVIGKREPIKIEYDSEIANLSNSDSAQASIPNLKTKQTASAIQTISSSNNHEVISSKNGIRYHYSHCAGAKQIKAENKIVFSTPQAAEAAGYTLASNCKPK